MSTVHVVPLADLIVHEVPGGYSEPVSPTTCWLAIKAVGEHPDSCPCWPTTELVAREDGPDGWIVTHHSLDGREGNE